MDDKSGTRMTRRGWQTSERASPAAPPPGRAASAAGDASTNGALAWDELYHAIAPAERERLLALAARQGLLYEHQLHEVRSTSADCDSCQRLLETIFSGRLDELEPVAVQSVAVIDSDSDSTQREAVAKALSTPDLCLIQGFPGTGKSR